MQTDEAKALINAILGSDVRFDGHFDKCFSNIKDAQQEEIIEWVKACKELKSSPIQSKTNSEMIGFVKRIGSNLRAILTKEKKGYFIELFLDKHKYYETEMKKLGF
ncbi:MAG: hypothetical protein Q8O89_01210 [Nanoarchaeota archaeon]|nr:hypothetical protein [Nanoarchaeota archaeon]